MKDEAELRGRVTTRVRMGAYYTVKVLLPLIGAAPVSLSLPLKDRCWKKMRQAEDLIIRQDRKL